jgi:hypothetical protein
MFYSKNMILETTPRLGMIAMLMKKAFDGQSQRKPIYLYPSPPHLAWQFTGGLLEPRGCGMARFNQLVHEHPEYRHPDISIVTL